MDSLKAWIEQRPKRAVLVTAVVAVIIGLVIGLGAGYKIEHDRVASDVKKTKKPAAAAKNKTSTTKIGLTRAAGAVSTVGPTSFVVKTAAGADRTVNVTASTTYENATVSTKTDIVKGRHVFIVAPGSEVLILPVGSTLGRAITDVTATSFKVAGSKGLPAGTVKLTSTVVIETATAGTKADVKAGGHAMALGSSTKGGPVNATEVIALPAGTKFSS
jgi:hypothetical protein